MEQRQLANERFKIDKGNIKESIDKKEEINNPFCTS